MVQKFLKNKRSKRMTCKRKYKIAKRSKEHKRKVKKEAKLKPKSNRSQKPKTVNVPNKAPFKEEVLQEAERRKKQAEELKVKRKEERQNAFMANRKIDLKDLQLDAQKRTTTFENKTDIEEKLTNDDKLSDRSAKAYYKEFRKVVESADVVIQVLDARDPLGCRCTFVEQEVLAKGKKLVLLLNKIDLIPKDNLEAWLKCLKKELPTIPFKASTQLQKHKLSQKRFDLNSYVADAVIPKFSQCLGAELVTKLLGNYCRNKDIKTTIKVGIIGFPNVGKSSIINSLKRSKVCPVGSTPGVTKVSQEIHLDKHIVLLDTPGVIWSKSISNSEATLRNATRPTSFDESLTAVEAILRRANQTQLTAFYQIGAYKDGLDFLRLLGKRFGRLKRGGRPDEGAAAKRVLKDWNEGIIKYYTHPPEEQQAVVHLSSEIVSELSKEFDIDSLFQDEQETVNAASKGMTMKTVEMECSGPSDFRFEDETGEDAESVAMETQSVAESSCTVTAGTSGPRPKKKKQAKGAQTPREQYDDVRGVKIKNNLKNPEVRKGTGTKLEGNQQLNKQKTLSAKKARKQQAKQKKRAGAATPSTPGSSTENYSFDTDFKMQS